MIGPGTSKAFNAYLAANGPIDAETLDDVIITSMENYTRDGFRTQSERDEANRFGFSDARTYAQARAGAFETYADYSRGKTIGFYTRTELLAFDASGFRDKATFESARRAGYNSRTEYEAFLASELKRLRLEAELLLSDAETYLRLNPTVAGIENIVRSAASLRQVLSSNAPALLSERTIAFSDTLSGLPDFAGFQTVRSKERLASREAQVNALVQRLSDHRDSVRRWMARNLTHKSSADFANVLHGLDTALVSRNIDDLNARALEIEQLIATAGISAELEQARDAPASGKDGMSVTVTDLNRFLLEGPTTETVALYNSTSPSSSVAKNLRGEFVFEDRPTRICAFPAISDPAMHRAVNAEFAALGSSGLDWHSSSCEVSDLSKLDVILLARGEFLKSAPKLVVEVLDLIESRDWRELPAFRHAKVQSRISDERQLAADIAADVEAGSRNGFGAIVASFKRPELCAVVPAGDPIHLPMIDQIRVFMASEGQNEATVGFVDAESAFKGIQRRQCGVVYADQPQLRLIAEALRDDRQPYSFLPLWLRTGDVAVRQTELNRQRQAILQAAEQRRIAAEEERRLAKETADRNAADATVRREELRGRYGADARALEKIINDGLKRVLLGLEVTGGARDLQYDTAAPDYFAAFEIWRSRLPNDYWEPTEVSTQIIEYGVANWKDRNLEAFSVEARIKQVSRERGERRENCFVFALIADREFEMWRDGFVEDCSTMSGTLQRWKAGNRFVSRWNP